jgi:hypothetical protein
MSTPRLALPRCRVAGALATAIVALVALAAATPAQAVVNMYYKGSLIIESFGNDTTTGTAYPFNTFVVLGIPFGQHCNPFYGPGTYSCDFM